MKMSIVIDRMRSRVRARRIIGRAASELTPEMWENARKRLTADNNRHLGLGWE